MKPSGKYFSPVSPGAAQQCRAAVAAAERAKDEIADLRAAVEALRRQEEREQHLREKISMREQRDKADGLWRWHHQKGLTMEEILGGPPQKH